MSWLCLADVVSAMGAIFMLSMSMWMLIDARRHRREMDALRAKSDEAHREFLDVSERLKRSLEQLRPPDKPKDPPS